LTGERPLEVSLEYLISVKYGVLTRACQTVRSSGGMTTFDDVAILVCLPIYEAIASPLLKYCGVVNSDDGVETPSRIAGNLLKGVVSIGTAARVRPIMVAWQMLSHPDRVWFVFW
jgi:hypothetical protein